MNEMRYTAKYRTERQIAVIGRAYCGLNFIPGGSGKSVSITFFQIRLKGDI